jgi:hypothetical protein
MKANALAKGYGSLTRLIMAAGSRGDEAEGYRLMRASQRIHLSFPDHAPYAQAFEELLFLTYIELLDDAAFYQECNARADRELSESIQLGKSKRKKAISTVEDTTSEGVTVEFPAWHRTGRTAYAAGFLFKVKVDGWKLFCAGLNVSPVLLWEQAEFPGLDRLRRALTLVNLGAAFPTTAAMACWLNEVRPAGVPEHSEADIMTAERFARSLDMAFRERVKSWGG